jgi:hypothetical protein
VAAAGRFGGLVKTVVSSTVVVCLIAAASFLLAVAGATVEGTTWSRVIAALAALADVAFVILALRLARVSHAGQSLPRDCFASFECRARVSARWPKADASLFPSSGGSAIDTSGGSA